VHDFGSLIEQLDDLDVYRVDPPPAIPELFNAHVSSGSFALR
jgi:hypothetical protein